MRPIVPGNEPPPCANAMRRRGSRSSTPPKITEQIASAVSVGIPTSHGSQYFVIRSFPSMSHGWTKTQAPRSAAASKTGKRSG